MDNPHRAPVRHVSMEDVEKNKDLLRDLHLLLAHHDATSERRSLHEPDDPSQLVWKFDFEVSRGRVIIFTFRFPEVGL